MHYLWKVGLALVVIGSTAHDASAFGRCGRGGWRGGGCGGYGGYAAGGWGYAGGGYPGYGWGYPGYGASGYGIAYPAGGLGSYPANQIQARTAYRPSSADAGSFNDRAELVLTVPSSAKVVINDYQTTTTGERRTYFSSGLQAGRVYPYQIRVEYVRDGKAVSQQSTVELSAGQSRALTFDDSSANEVVSTTPSTTQPPEEAP